MHRSALALLACTLAACGGSNETDAGRIEADAGDPPFDAGKPDAGQPDAGSDAGPLPLTCEMGQVRIREMCPAFTPCTSTFEGTWCYADVCIEKDDLLARVLEQPGVPEECTADEIELLASMGSIEGTIVITDLTMTRMIETTVTGTFVLPADCTIVNCRTTEAAIVGALGDMGTATCADAAPDGCECDITFDSMVDTNDGYTSDGDTITTDNGRTFDVCVEEGNLRFRETSEGGEPGVQTALSEGTP
jgi:hypothetical protein